MTTYREMRAIERKQALELSRLSRDGVTVTTCERGKADGLWHDVGNEGKGNRHAWANTFGEGDRRGSILADCWSDDVGCKVYVRAR